MTKALNVAVERYFVLLSRSGPVWACERHALCWLGFSQMFRELLIGWKCNLSQRILETFQLR